jgi:hypothetical protein
MNNIEIAKLPDEDKLRISQALQNSELFEKKLLEAFPLDCDPSKNYFSTNTFEGDDEQNYLALRRVFEGKNWNEVDLTLLVEKNLSTGLDEDGNIYYLPAVLKFNYDLRVEMLDLYLISSTIEGLAIGFSSTRYRIGADGWSYLVPTDYSAFDQFTTEQSKLIAGFLVHISTLSLFSANYAKSALKNYWGKFLIL